MGYASAEQIQTIRAMFDGFEEQVIEEVLVANKGDMEATIDTLLSMNADNGKKQQQQKQKQETKQQPINKVDSPKVIVPNTNTNTVNKNPPNSPVLTPSTPVSFNITPVIPDATPINSNNNNNTPPQAVIPPAPTTPTPSSDESKLVTLRNEVLKEFQKLSSQQLAIDQQRAQINQEVAKLEQQKKELMEQQNLFEQAKAAFSRSSSLLESSVEARKIQLEQEYKEKEAQFVQFTLREYEGRRSQSDSEKLSHEEEKQRIRLEEEAKREAHVSELTGQHNDEMDRFEQENEVLKLEIKSLKHSLMLSEQKREQAQKVYKDILVSSYTAIFEGIKKIAEEENFEAKKKVDDEEDEITNLLIKNFISKGDHHEEEGAEKHTQGSSTTTKEEGVVVNKDEMFVSKEKGDTESSSHTLGFHVIPEEPWVGTSSDPDINLPAISSSSEQNTATPPPLSFPPVGEVTLTPSFEREEETEVDKSVGSLSFLPPHYTTPNTSSSSTPLFGSTLSSSSSVASTTNPTTINNNNNPPLFPTSCFPPVPNPPFSYPYNMVAYNPYGYTANTQGYYTPAQNQGVNNPNSNINYNYQNPWTNYNAR